ncbi:MAG: hypothetical protein K6E94_04180 [Elusimicrobiaceae bacterium]|nr:hypothetical protein [Elusimicrobiaceae bacterium]
MKDMITRYVCDRCRKEITAFLRMETTRVSDSGILVTGSYLLCDKCADDFTDHFIDGYMDDRTCADIPDETTEERDDTSTEKQVSVYWDLGDNKLLKVPASIHSQLVEAAAEKAKGGNHDA